jgi:hypothetical protein
MLLIKLSQSGFLTYEWKDGLRTNRKGRLIWYTDGSKTSIGIEAGVNGYVAKPRLKFQTWTLNYSFPGRSV